MGSTPEQVWAFLVNLYNVDNDDFILDRREVYNGELNFDKVASPDCMVIKMVRYHHLIPKLLMDVDELKVIGIVRNPCAVINSWLQAPKEFQEGWDPQAEWRWAPKKNQGRIEEYNGFEKWREVAQLFLDLSTRYPERFYLLRYENLVAEPILQVEQLLTFAGLPFHTQVIHFIQRSRSEHHEDPYSVFKAPSVKDRWREDLNATIRQKIVEEVTGTRLERFLR